MKRTVTYIANYKGISQNFNRFHKDEKDKIEEKLGESCISLGNNYLWYENGLFYIKVDDSNLSKNYTKRIEIEMMPVQSQLPKDLAKLLEDHGYKYQEPKKASSD